MHNHRSAGIAMGGTPRCVPPMLREWTRARETRVWLHNSHMQSAISSRYALPVCVLCHSPSHVQVMLPLSNTRIVASHIALTASHALSDRAPCDASAISHAVRTDLLILIHAATPHPLSTRCPSR